MRRTPLALIHRRSFSAFTIGLALFGSTAFAQSADLKKNIAAHTQPYIDAEVAKAISIGVLSRGDRTTAHFGEARPGVTPNDQSVYEIGSISKVFTGLLLASAVEAGEVKLDQPATELAPKGSTFPKWEDREITLLDLATHQSGLPRLGNNMPSLRSNNPYHDYTSKLGFEFVSNHKLIRAPGSKYQYSNLGASLLGYLVAQPSRVSYDEMLEARITAPLKMESTSVAMTDSMKSRLALPHSTGNTPNHNWDFADLPGAGGIRSTIDDMLRFAAAQLSPPDNATGKAIELAWKEHANAGQKMGLGWHFAGDGQTRWHNGQTGGYHSMLLVNRQQNTAVVVLCNTATREVDRLANDLIRVAIGAEVEPRTFEKTIEVAEDVMKRYEGKYQLAPGFVFDVKVDDKKLMVRLANQPTLRVYPKSETEWFYKQVQASLTFKMNSDGECESLTLFQNGIRQTAKRIR